MEMTKDSILESLARTAKILDKIDGPRAIIIHNPVMKELILKHWGEHDIRQTHGAGRSTSGNDFK
jgi:hypothetical protein